MPGTQPASSRVHQFHTFHEQLDPVGLVHMNGRVYDPELGRFMSPDIAIQDITNLQALNSYTYVNNNPLSFTDPSGFFLSGLFKSIGRFFRSVFRAVVGAFKAVLDSQIGRAIIQIAACSFGGPACVALTGAITLAAGGSLRSAVMAMAFTALSVGTWTQVGNYLHPIVATQGLGGQAFSVATHAVVGGALSVAQGGSFMEGFAAGGIGDVGSFAGFSAFGTGSDGLYARTALAATMGGLASEITGGKFANGAVTGAFGHLFNAEGGDLLTKRALHEMAVEAVALNMEAEGYEIVASQDVAALVPGLGKRYYDLIVRSEDGSFTGMEVKTAWSDEIRLRTNQVLKDAYVSRHGALTTTGISISHVGYAGYSVENLAKAYWSSKILQSG